MPKAVRAALIALIGFTTLLLLSQAVAIMAEGSRIGLSGPGNELFAHSYGLYLLRIAALLFSLWLYYRSASLWPAVVFAACILYAFPFGGFLESALGLVSSADWARLVSLSALLSYGSAAAAVLLRCASIKKAMNTTAPSLP